MNGTPGSPVETMPGKAYALPGMADGMGSRRRKRTPPTWLASLG